MAHTSAGAGSRGRQRRSGGHAAVESSGAAPTAKDQTRYFDWRAGVSMEELATRENVRLATVRSSIEKMRAQAAKYSAEQAEIATRQMYIEGLPHGGQALIAALQATRTEYKSEMELVYDKETQEPSWKEVKTATELPDHAVRLNAVDRLTKVLSTIIPKTPLVSNNTNVDARTQIAGNVGGGQALAAPQHQGALSAESIIRQIRQQRGLDTVEVVKQLTPGAELADKDFELERELAEEAEAEAGEGEYVEGDGGAEPEGAPD